MGELLGTLAGVGMLLLIVALLCVFFRQCGLLSADRIRRLRTAGLTTIGAAAAYFLTAALLHGMFYAPAANPLALEEIFRCSLRFPGLDFFFSESLTLLMTWLGASLLLTRFEIIAGEKTAQEALFLLFCLPGAVFLFLPGWPPAAFLAFSILFFAVGSQIKKREFSYPAQGYACLLAVCAMLSAMAVYAFVTRPVA